MLRPFCRPLRMRACMLSAYGVGCKRTVATEVSERKEFSSRGELEGELKKITIDASTKIDGIQDPFSHPLSRFQILSRSIDVTGVNIPSKDLASIQTDQDLLEYVWGEMERGEVSEDAAVVSAEDLPPNLSFGENEPEKDKKKRPNKYWKVQQSRRQQQEDKDNEEGYDKSEG
mmetsp:Transcript_4690/g.6642  ORF Transcript_4690/g.6642 Transcript_4690/m.6642 type:complete len:173 (-) Transcript_4690:49-567(-)